MPEHKGLMQKLVDTVGMDDVFLWVNEASKCLAEVVARSYDKPNKLLEAHIKKLKTLLSQYDVGEGQVQNDGEKSEGGEGESKGGPVEHQSALCRRCSMPAAQLHCTHAFTHMLQATSSSSSVSFDYFPIIIRLF